MLLWISVLFVVVDADIIPPLSSDGSGSSKEPGYPVLLVHGFGGAQFEANLTGKPQVVHVFCESRTKEYFDLWLNLELLLPGILDCLVDNMRNVYNATTGNSSSMPGVDIRIPDFGGTAAMEWLDKSKVNVGRYFVDIAEWLVHMGYTRRMSLVGAPYNWRLAPYELGDYYGQLKDLIEATYQKNGNKSVVIVSHSMGSPVMLYFYNHIVDQLLAFTPDKNYTLGNLQEFFMDIDYEDGWSQYLHTRDLLGNLSAPNVEVHCVYGFGVPTPELLHWPRGYFPDYDPFWQPGDGDGTVNLRSLDACSHWIGHNGGKNVTVYQLDRSDHHGILKDERTLKIIEKVAYGLPVPTVDEIDLELINERYVCHNNNSILHLINHNNDIY